MSVMEIPRYPHKRRQSLTAQFEGRMTPREKMPQDPAQMRDNRARA